MYVRGFVQGAGVALRWALLLQMECQDVRGSPPWASLIKRLIGPMSLAPRPSIEILARTSPLPTDVQTNSTAGQISLCSASFELPQTLSCFLLLFSSPVCLSAVFVSFFPLSIELQAPPLGDWLTRLQWLSAGVWHAAHPRFQTNCAPMPSPSLLALL
jgi:hypothetical protein